MGDALRRSGLFALLMALAATGTSHAGSLRTDVSRALVPLDEIISGGRGQIS